jgi:predicted nucleotide-binding protein (sugar kinase/HSP70/actin superfamily)
MPDDDPTLIACPDNGIPPVKARYRSAPLLLHYLRALGVPEKNLLLSPTTSPALFHSGTRFGANDPCFPSKLVLSHVDWLLSRPEVDVLFLPSISHAAIAVRGSADTASCPVVAAAPHTVAAALRRSPDTRSRDVPVLSPALGLLDPEGLEARLFESFGGLLGVSRAASRRALAYGRAAQARFHVELRRRGARMLARARRDGRAAAVMLMRPYHADPGVCHGITTALAARGVPVLGLSALPLGTEDELTLSGEEALTTNSGCAEKLWAARRVAASPELVAVELGSFRCGQDASILGALSDILGGADKPTLRLYDLDEDRPAATLDVRLDTFVGALRGYETRVLRAEPATETFPNSEMRP